MSTMPEEGILVSPSIEYQELPVPFAAIPSSNKVIVLALIDSLEENLNECLDGPVDT